MRSPRRNPMRNRSATLTLKLEHGSRARATGTSQARTRSRLAAHPAADGAAPTMGGWNNGNGRC